ncbi:MAG: radical SAM protein [Anaerolineae bacterium]
MSLEFVAPGIEGQVFVNVRPQAITVSLDTVPNYAFDREGRLFAAYVEGHNYRRTMDNRVIEKWAQEEGGVKYRLRRELPPAEKRAFLEGVYATVERIHRALAEGTFRLVPSPRCQPETLDQVRGALEQILGWDYRRLEGERGRFLAVYKPIGILPPDQYMALVLQATEGCSYNRCTFCQFYRDRRFRIKSMGEFREHIQAVKALFGRALGLRKSIFLADANALVIPQRRLLPLLEAINEAFAFVPPSLMGSELAHWKATHPLSFEGVYSFVSALDALRKSPHDFRALASLNLRRVYIGLESGDEALLRFLNKPGTVEDALRAVATIKAGGVNVGVIIMTGIGGQQYAAHHVAHTIEAINAMPLGAGDIIYFSEFVEFPASEYARRAAEEGIVPLSREQIRAQTEAIRAGFVFPHPSQRPKISIYDIREFIY